MTVAHSFTAIGSALYSAIGTAAGTVEPTAIYQGIATQGAAPPYILFNRQTAADRYTFTSRGISATYQIKVVSNKAWPGEAQIAYDRIHTSLQDAALTATGYALMRMRRETTIEYQDNERFWHVGGIYRIDTEET